MSFGGTHDPAAFIRLVSFGKLDAASNRQYAAELSELVKESYGVEPERCFIEFSPIEAHMVARCGKTLEELFEI